MENMNFLNTLTSMSARVFPGLSHKLPNKFSDNEMNTNLPLQMALYFNVVLFPVWLIVMITFLTNAYDCYTELYKFISVAVMFTLILIEMLRLYLGYEGNLRDKIPELAGFWMLSLLIQFPLQGFLLLNPYFHLGPMEKTIQAIIFIMLIIQLVSGYVALKFTAKQQATFFRIMKLKSDISAANFYDKYKVL